MHRLPPAVAGGLADLVLAVHAGIALFALAMLMAILAGGPLGWRWVRRPLPRLLHVGLVLVVAVQAWLGRLCPLTVWEQALRARAGQAVHGGSFVEYWLSRLLFFEAPWWAFVVAYTLLLGSTLLAWWRWPPRRSRRIRP